MMKLSINLTHSHSSRNEFHTALYLSGLYLCMCIYYIDVFKNCVSYQASHHYRPCHIRVLAKGEEKKNIGRFSGKVTQVNGIIA